MITRCHVVSRGAVCLAFGLLAACAWEPPVADLADDHAGDPAEGRGRRGALGASAHALLTDVDLVVRSVSGPPSAMPGAWLPITAEVCNQGGLDAPPSRVRVVLSADDVIDAGDPILAEQDAPYLAPGACARVMAPGMVPGGPAPVTRYHLGAIADALELIGEADEANNASAGRLLAVGHDADLVVDRVRAPATAGPEHGPAGGPIVFEAEVRVCNQGQAPSAPSSVELQLAEEGNPETPPAAPPAAPPVAWPVAWIDVPPLDPGDCFNGTARPYLWQVAAVYQIAATVDPADQVVELVEDNNTHAAGRLGVGYEADLVVTAIASAGSAAPGGSAPVRVTVCNQGFSPAYQTHVEVLLSEDDVLDPMSDAFMGAAPVPALQPQQCITADAAYAHVPWLQGTFRIAAVVDRYDAEPEIFEDNNARVGDRFGVGWDADLVVTEVTRVPGRWPSENFDLRVRVCNRGQQYSYHADVELRFSRDDEITAADAFAGMAPVPGLAPGACVRVPAWAYAPPEQGAYVLGAIVDPHDQVIELIETNNTAAGPRVGIGYGPDLVVTAVNAPALANVWGGDTSVFVQVCNHGRAPSSSIAVDLYASRNDDISVDDVFVGREYAPGLAQGACTSIAVRAMLDVPQHRRYLLGAVVNPDESAFEIIADNNVGFSAPVGIGHGPDLVVTAMTAPPSVQPGAAFEVSTTVCNQGFAPSYGAPLVILASEDDHIHWWNDWNIRHEFIHPLQPGQCHTVTVPVSLYGPAQWLGAMIDPGGSVDEIREDNDIHVGPRLGVGHEPDLVVTALSAPPTVQPYEFMEVTARVCNQGQGSSGGAEVFVYLGDGAPLAPGQPPAGVGHAPWLEPGACSDVIVPASGMYLSGEQTLTAAVDPHRWVPELVDDNNTASTPIGIGYEPDLIVAHVTGPASALPWSPFDVTARVCNQGEWDSQGARLDVVLSHDAAADATDLVIGTTGLPWLAQGTCQDITLPVHASLFRGVYTLGAVVHQGGGPPELVTSNNGAAGGLLAIGYEADLVVGAVTGPATVAAGVEFSIDVTVCNQGQGPSQPTEVWPVLSHDAIVDMGDVQYAPAPSAPIPGLAPGACETSRIQAFAYHPEGSYVLGALVDPWGMAYELVESNNTGAGGTLAITPL
jgi:subtilase family serine protease